MRSISGEKHLLAQFALWNQTPLNLQLLENKTKNQKEKKKGNKTKTPQYNSSSP